VFPSILKSSIRVVWSFAENGSELSHVFVLFGVFALPLLLLYFYLFLDLLSINLVFYELRNFILVVHFIVLLR